MIIQQLLTSSLLFLPDGGRGSLLAALSSDWLGSEVMLACVPDGCGCEELLFERAGAPVLLRCSVSARENGRVGGQSHTRMQEGGNKQLLQMVLKRLCFLPTFHAGGYRQNISCTVVYALLLFHQHGQQTRAETHTQADFITTKQTDSNPRSQEKQLSIRETVLPWRSRWIAKNWPVFSCWPVNHLVLG